jgi:ParB family chromosome partitioning protein
VDLDLLSPNPFQPRLQMDEKSLQELAQSIRQNGIIQPIVVRRSGERYEIVAGERRWRAAQIAGLLRVPIAVRDIPDTKLLEVALIENIQRENLNPIDEALAYRRLIDEFHLTQEAVAVAVGKDRTSVANYLRLLKLPEDVQHEVAIGALSMGHARALVALDDAAAVRRAAGEVLGRRLSVRDTEALVRRMSEGRPEPVAESPKDVHTRQAEDVMKMALGTKVRIVRKGPGGQIEIDFVSEDELHRLYTYLTERR